MAEVPSEYIEYLKQNVNVLERLGDKFSGIDERVDYVVKQLAELKISEAVDSLVGVVDRLEEMGLAMPKSTEQIVFRETLAALQGVRIEEYAPFTGRITSAMFHFPNGCNALVDVAFGHGSKQILPNTGSLALNNATPVFPISVAVKESDVLWVTMKNGDAINPHTPSVTITMVGD